MILPYPTREALLTDVESRAYLFEQQYHGCAQCVLAALMECFPMLLNPEAFKAATGLAGGVGLSTEGSCGGLTGGVMALSLFLGRQLNDLADKEGGRFAAYRMANRLHEQFVATYGSSTCGRIHQKIMGKTFHLNRTEEWNQFIEAGGHSEKCPSVVGMAAKWTAVLLLEAAEAAGKPFRFTDAESSAGALIN